MSDSQPRSLPAGTYVLRCKEESLLRAGLNGHSLVWPACEAVSDGSWVSFFRGGKEIYRCNALYAAATFIIDQPRGAFTASSSPQE
jgi:hypothetical protein